jgi:hypothetical protein
VKNCGVIKVVFYEYVKQAIENLSDEQKVLMLIPMGYIYSARGIHSSFEIHREGLKNTKMR